MLNHEDTKGTKEGNPITQPIPPQPPHEEFGYDVVRRALAGEPLTPWENDIARLFWQSLEIHNGGFEQWIGNTGTKEVFDTLEILGRHKLTESYRLTQQAIDLLKLRSYTGDISFYNYLEANVEDWFERLRPLDEAYWDDAANFDARLKEIYNTNVT